MELNLIDIVSITASFVAIIFILFLLSIRIEQRLPNFLLAFYLLLLIIDTLSQFTWKYVLANVPAIAMLLSLTVLLVMPTFYLFVKSSVYRDFRLSAGSILHLLPYILAVLILIPGYFMVHHRGEFTAAYAVEMESGTLIKIIYLGIYMQLVVYFALIFIELRRYRQILVENYSNPNMGNYRWIMQFVLLLLVMDIISLVRNVLRFSSSNEVFDLATLIVVINILIFVSWILIKSLKDPGIFTGIYHDTQLVKKMLGGMEDENAQDHHSPEIARIREYMEEKEPFLDSSLSVYELSDQLDMSVRELSLLINHTLNQHFFDFVNHYRIEKAKSILADPANKQFTVLEVLYEVGFNSKSSFNTVFKKCTGLTPTQFRKSQIASEGMQQ